MCKELLALGDLVLGIETSCDETAAAVALDGKKILSNIVASQVDWHKKFKGVVPEIASRKHLEFLGPVVDEALERAKVNFSDISLVAVTQGPGLVGALLVGMAYAKAVSYALSLPAVGVNHLEGHIYANFFSFPKLSPPFVSLVISGGHTSLVYVKDFGKYELMGETLDDAAGEAFDKVAKFLDLGYPGGPIIDKLAQKGNPKAINFPRAMLKTNDFNFSLSGLKTAVLNYVSKEKGSGKKISLPDLAASFEAAIIDVQVEKTFSAAYKKGVKTIVLGGGVVANASLRKSFEERARKEGFELYFPPLELCTDNAAMIACAGYFRYMQGERLSLDANPDPNLPLGS